MKKTNVAIIGTGKIGCDLLVKVMASPYLDCKWFIGRNSESSGINFGKKLGINCADKGLTSLLENIDDYDVIFDATSASSHLENRKMLKKYNKKIINLTPEHSGIKCVPSVNLKSAHNEQVTDMITCGGQVSIPMICAVKSMVAKMEYIEVVTSISSKSAGLATRQNINEYLESTEAAITEFSGCKSRKVILNINPAEPSVNMQTTISMLINDYDTSEVLTSIQSMLRKVQEYVPHYNLVCDPIFSENKLIIIIRAKGNGDYLPSYAGNLDIITSASIKVALSCQYASSS